VCAVQHLTVLSCWHCCCCCCCCCFLCSPGQGRQPTGPCAAGHRGAAGVCAVQHLTVLSCWHCCCCCCFLCSPGQGRQPTGPCAAGHRGAAGVCAVQHLERVGARGAVPDTGKHSTLQIATCLLQIVLLVCGVCCKQVASEFSPP
jgi:hypothetical protein